MYFLKLIKDFTDYPVHIYHRKLEFFPPKGKVGKEIVNELPHLTGALDDQSQEILAFIIESVPVSFKKYT